MRIVNMMDVWELLTGCVGIVNMEFKKMKKQTYIYWFTFLFLMYKTK
jgi:hypothetical protein